MVIDVHNVTKTYTSLNRGNAVNADVIKDLSFEVADGTSLGIIGRNGSGKSTLLKLLSGIIKPDKGSIRIWGKVSSLLDVGSGMIPELTGMENIKISLALLGYSKVTTTLIDEIVAFSELEDHIHKPVKNYSNGMFLRLAFAIQTTARPDIMIVDEVLAVGDEAFKEKCMYRLNAIKAQGTSLVLVSHNMSEIEEYTDKAILLENGQMARQGDSKNVIVEFLQKLPKYKSERDKTDENTQVEVVAARLSSNKILANEPLTVSIEVVIKQQDLYDMVIYVSDISGVVLSDSPSYRETGGEKVYAEGRYILNCELPAHFFNKGKFFVGFLIGNRKYHFYLNYRMLSFDVESPAWDRLNVWNLHHEFYPLRPQLVWTIS